MAIIAAREVVSDLANLFLRNVKIVDQPLGCRGDGAFLADGRANGAIGGEQHPAIVPQPGCQWPAEAGPRGDALCSRQARGMLNAAFDAEKLGADRLLGRRGGSEQRAYPAAKKRNVQLCLSARKTARVESQERQSNFSSRGATNPKAR